MFFDPIWLAAGAAASVDQILMPAELENPELIEVVYRTHQEMDSGFVLPHRAFGIATVICATIGLLSLR